MSDRQRYLSAFLLTFVVFGIGWFAILYLDPLGFVGETGLKTQEVVGKLKSGFYGFRSDAEGQSRIAVVLITDKTLEDGETYPLPTSLHRHYLEQIVAQRPAMVFVDLGFFGERLGDHLSDLTEPMKRAGIPALFAGGPAGASMPPELEKYRAITGWRAPDWAYPLWQLDPHKRSCPTAAMALYLGLHGEDVKCRDLPVDQDFRDNLVVQWGATLPPEQVDVSRVPTECRFRGAGWRERLAESAYISLSSLAPGLSEHGVIGQRQPCFYALTIRAETLDHWNDTGALQGLLRGRVVLYGANVSGVPDLAYSAVHGTVPGVFVHAMALDNLLTYGRRYYHDPAYLSPLCLDMALGLILIGIASHLRGRAAQRRAHKRAPDPDEAHHRVASDRVRRFVSRVAARQPPPPHRAGGGAALHGRAGTTFHLAVGVALVLNFLLNELVLHWAVRNLLGSFILIELMQVVVSRVNPVDALQELLLRPPSSAGHAETDPPSHKADKPEHLGRHSHDTR